MKILISMLTFVAVATAGCDNSTVKSNSDDAVAAPSANAAPSASASVVVAAPVEDASAPVEASPVVSSAPVSSVTPSDAAGADAAKVAPVKSKK